MENKHTNGPWEDRAIRLEFQLRRLIYGYRISGVDALKSEEWKILYDIAEAILVEGNPIDSTPSLQSEIDRLKEEKKELIEAVVIANNILRYKYGYPSYEYFESLLTRIK